MKSRHLRKRIMRGCANNIGVDSIFSPCYNSAGTAFCLACSALVSCVFCKYAQKEAKRTGFTGRCGGTVYALVSKTSPARVEGSNLSIGISPFLASNSVHLYAHPLTLARLDRACS